MPSKVVAFKASWPHRIVRECPSTRLPGVFAVRKRAAVPEAGCLLTVEVPDAVLGHSYYEGTVAAAIAKRRERMFYVRADAVKAVEAHMATPLRSAIGRARQRGDYEQVRGKLTVTRVSKGRRRTLVWEEARQAVDYAAADGAGFAGW